MLWSSGKVVDPVAFASPLQGAARRVTPDPSLRKGGRALHEYGMPTGDSADEGVSEYVVTLGQLRSTHEFPRSGGAACHAHSGSVWSAQHDRLPVAVSSPHLRDYLLAISMLAKVDFDTGLRHLMLDYPLGIIW
jgi:hypothetical protein